MTFSVHPNRHGPGRRRTPWFPRPARVDPGDTLFVAVPGRGGRAGRGGGQGRRHGAGGSCGASGGEPPKPDHRAWKTSPWLMTIRPSPPLAPHEPRTLVRAECHIPRRQAAGPARPARALGGDARLWERTRHRAGSYPGTRRGSRRQGRSGASPGGVSPGEAPTVGDPSRPPASLATFSTETLNGVGPGRDPSGPRMKMERGRNAPGCRPSAGPGSVWGWARADHAGGNAPAHTESGNFVRSCPTDCVDWARSIRPRDHR
jgi:hypothetical protein